MKSIILLLLAVATIGACTPLSTKPPAAATASTATSARPTDTGGSATRPNTPLPTIPTFTPAFDAGTFESISR